MNETLEARAGSNQLHLVAIVEDSDTVALMQRVLSQTGDGLSVTSDLTEGVALAAAEVPDVVLIDVTLGDTAGLAVVHHVRAIAPGVAIYALANEDTLGLGAQAVALGGTGVLMMPLSGDELLTALADVRTRRAERELRRQLQAEAATSRRAAELAAELAVVAEASSRRSAAEKLLPLLCKAADASAGLVYLPAGEGSRQLLRAAELGSLPVDPPSFCEEMELCEFASAYGLEIVRLSLRREQSGMALLKLPSNRLSAELGRAVGVLAAQAATMLALVGEREQSQRSAMKDPASSAYTFAYFVDVAGREIDKARRYGRRFALATIALGEDVSTGEPSNWQAVEIVDRVLSVVRDTDILARVDENEFYLLMPETGGLGAQICRRRVIRELAGLRGLRGSGRPRHALMMGVATFPHDGGDLSQLLRVAKHRAEASQSSIVWRAGLDRLALGEMFDAIMWSESAAIGTADLDSVRAINLPSVDIIALGLAAVTEAVRGGKTRIVASHRAGMSIGGAVRSALERDRDDISFDAIDLANVADCTDLEVLAVTAQHGVYALLGRHETDSVRAFHAADPLLVDLLIQRLGEAAGLGGLD